MLKSTFGYYSTCVDCLYLYCCRCHVLVKSHLPPSGLSLRLSLLVIRIRIFDSGSWFTVFALDSTKTQSSLFRVLLRVIGPHPLGIGWWFFSLFWFVEIVKIIVLWNILALCVTINDWFRLPMRVTCRVLCCRLWSNGFNVVGRLSSLGLFGLYFYLDDFWKYRNQSLGESLALLSVCSSRSGVSNYFH